jgi:uncharacterized membrane protein
MKLIVAAVALFLFGAFSGYEAVIWYLPWQQMQVSYATWKPANTWIHAKLQAGKRNWVPAGNPDFLISRATYDLRNGPLLIEGEWPKASFMVIGMYGGDTRIFGCVDSIDHQGQRYRLLLRKAGSQAVVPGAQTIDAPSDRGYLVIRLLVTKTLSAAERDQVYRSASIVLASAELQGAKPGNPPE